MYVQSYACSSKVCGDCIKEADEVIEAYVRNLYAQFGGSLKILSDNGSEFKNAIFTKVAKVLGIKLIHSYHYYLQGMAKKSLSQLPKIMLTETCKSICRVG